MQEIAELKVTDDNTYITISMFTDGALVIYEWIWCSSLRTK